MKNKFKLLTLLSPIALATPIIATVSCSADTDIYVPINPNEEGTFDVGMTLDYAPYDFRFSPLQYELIKKQSETTDEIYGDGVTKAQADAYIKMIAPIKTGGYVAGFDIFIASEVAKARNQELMVHYLEFDKLIPAVRDKQLDAAMDGMSITAEREESVQFSNSYTLATNTIIYDTKDVSGTVTIDNIRNKRVGVIETSAQETIAKNIASIYGFTVVPFRTQYDVENAIKADRVDIQIAENTAAHLAAKYDTRLGSIDSLAWNGRELEDDINPEPDEIAIALNKDEDITDINRVLTTIFPDKATKDAKFNEAEEMYAHFNYHNQ